MRVTLALEVMFSLLVILVFVNRYILGTIARLIDERASAAEQDPSAWPTVTIIVPTFNESAQIVKTAASLVVMDYPKDKLSIVFVDDCSTDDTPKHLTTVTRLHPHIRVERNLRNVGKRIGIKRAVRSATSDLVLSVDSDVVVERETLKHLVRHMLATDADAVGGCVYVSNASETWLTRMQAVKYWVGYQFLKNLENFHDQVMCLSGCLTLYKRSALLEIEHHLSDRRFLGDEVKYGEDRFLTRKLVEQGFRTRLTFNARCYTNAPSRFSGYLNQQLRWRRSNLVDFLTALSMIDRLHPIVCVHYCSVALIQLFYPVFLLAAYISWGFLLPLFVHVLIATMFAILFEYNKRNLPEFARASGIWFLSSALVFPIMYMFMTPLAFATLGTASWETRGAKASRPTFTHEPARLEGQIVADAAALSVLHRANENPYSRTDSKPADRPMALACSRSPSRLLRS